MRMYVSWPKRPSSSLNASPTSGSDALADSSTGASSSLRSSAVFSTSVGAGRYATTASRSGWTPLFLKAEPISTGTNALAIVCRRIAALSTSALGCSSARKRSAISSSTSASASSSACARAAAPRRASASGTSRTPAHLLARVPSKVIATFSTRSTTPAWSALSPIGSWIAAAFRCSLPRSCADDAVGVGALAVELVDEREARHRVPARGFICRSTGGDDRLRLHAGDPHRTRIAPSRTRSARSTSIVKSTWPGVSMMLISCRPTGSASPPTGW